MNKEQTIQAWKEGTLTGSELEQFEAWLAENPTWLDEQLASSETIASHIKSSIPAETEIPYPDFFNSRIKNAITRDVQQNNTQQSDIQEKVTPLSWGAKLRWAIIPAAAAATVAFFIGKTLPNTDNNFTQQTEQENIYVIQQGVEATLVDNSEVVEIVIEGLDPILNDFSSEAETTQHTQPQQEETILTTFTL